MTIDTYIQTYVFPGSFSVFKGNAIWHHIYDEPIVIVNDIQNSLEKITRFEIVKIDRECIFDNEQFQAKDKAYVLLAQFALNFSDGIKDVWIEVAASANRFQLEIWKDLNLC